MTITQSRSGDELTIKVSGSLNTITAPELANAVKEAIEGVALLVLDFSELEYISSAGLRVVRGASKTMADQGRMVVRGCNDEVFDVFVTTGFIDFINVE